jgi:hypothetical protein
MNCSTVSLRWMETHGGRQHQQGPRHIHLGQVDFLPRPMFLGTGTLLVLEGLLFLLYVRFGKFRHRDRMLSFHPWRGDEEGVLKPGGVAILSDYKRTAEYAGQLSQAGLTVERRWGNPLYTFPPLRIVVARKPQLSLR